MAIDKSKMSAQQRLAMQRQQNDHFMRFSYGRPIVANAQNGSAYAVGQARNFDAPIVAGAYATAIRIKFNVTFNYTAAGVSPYVNVTAGGAYNLFREMTVTFGGKQVTIHPYIAKVLAMSRGHNRLAPGSTLGNQNTAIQSLLHTNIAVAAGANTWKGYFDLPLNVIHPLSVAGIIPIGGSGTRLQVQLVPPSTFVGADPLENVVDTNGTIDTVTGSFSVEIIYRDHKSFSMPNPVQPDLTGLATAQIIKVPEINPLTAGSNVYKRLINPYPFVKVISLVIDGKQSSQFAAADNVTAFRIDSAENTSSELRVYDETTGGMSDYYIRTREVYGQDFDGGVLLYDSTVENSSAPSLMEGDAYLNLTQTGYPAARLGYKVASVDTTKGITPRIVTYGVILNPEGLK